MARNRIKRPAPVLAHSSSKLRREHYVFLYSFPDRGCGAFYAPDSSALFVSSIQTLTGASSGPWVKPPQPRPCGPWAQATMATAVDPSADQTGAPESPLQAPASRPGGIGGPDEDGRGGLADGEGHAAQNPARRPVAFARRAVAGDDRWRADRGRAALPDRSADKAGVERPRGADQRKVDRLDASLNGVGAVAGMGDRRVNRNDDGLARLVAIMDRHVAQRPDTMGGGEGMRGLSTRAEQKPALPPPRSRTIATRSAKRLSGAAPTSARAEVSGARACATSTRASATGGWRGEVMGAFHAPERVALQSFDDQIVAAFSPL